MDETAGRAAARPLAAFDDLDEAIGRLLIYARNFERVRAKCYGPPRSPGLLS